MSVNSTVTRTLRPRLDMGGSLRWMVVPGQGPAGRVGPGHSRIGAVAGQFSFDIVSEVDLQEVRNAVDQAAREISQRFDFKGTGTSVSLESDTIELHAGTEDRLKAAWQVLQEKAVRRQVPLKSLQPAEIQQAAKGTVRQSVAIVQGIPDEKAKQISKFVRGAVPKAQTQIQGSQLRVSAKSKDDLQTAIRAVKGEDFGLALQFTNYR